ncbi:PmoA family protein [Plantactinospora veratri]|uniref:PmoA family protein n=1 Tax=Plantactinospora veratri TaxID=1436122 RepID=A0ABU7SQ36_9ACTN
MGEDLTGVRLRVRGETVARYVLDDPHVDLRWGRRPYLHPVRTLGGVVVTDTLPEDHRWHLGVSVAMQDVSGTNLWGGRTYVRDAGYTWLDDHGRIVHDGWLPDLPTPDADPEGGGAAGGNGLDGGPGEGGPGDGGFAERLRWLDPAGATLLTEERRVGATGLADRTDAWLLDFGYTLTAPADREIVLGSPATNGRPDGAGYGGFFWRVAPGPNRAFTASAEGEERVNGSTEPWLAMVGAADGGRPYTLVFAGLADGDHWFVRTGIYPGVCVALAFERTLPVPAGASVRRRHRIVVADGELTRDEVEALGPVLTS